jgi:TolA-binding protein
VTHRAARVAVLVALVAVVAHAGPARAQGFEGLNAALVDVEGEAAALLGAPVPLDPPLSPTHVEERLTDAELSYRMHDYERAAMLLTDLVDRYPEHPAHPDALFLLGESLFQAGDSYGARTRLRELIGHVGEAGYRPYLDRALGRLIDIAIRTRSFDEVEGYFELLAQDPSLAAEASTAYFRGKYLYNRAIEPAIVLRTGRPDLPAIADAEGLEAARQSFEGVAADTPYHPQAVYFIGVIHALRGEHEQAIEAFRAVLALAAETPDHRAVQEHAKLSLARVLYEAHQLRDAVEAYQTISESSPCFPVALYESAWVHLQRHALEDAEQALALLLVTAPEDPRAPDAMILRGELLVQGERYDEADALFTELRDRFEPVRQAMEVIPAQSPDLRAYFRTVVRAHLDDLAPASFIPESARTWVRMHGSFARALGALAELEDARRTIRTIDDLIIRLRNALEAPNPITVLADLRAQKERVDAFRNRLAQLRGRVADVEAALDPAGGGALGRVRERRRELEQSMARFPTDAQDFRRRDATVVQRYRALGEQVPEVHRALLALEARLNGAEHALAERRIATGTAAAEPPELLEMREAVLAYRRAIRDLERGLEAGRLRVGVGDARSEEEAAARRQLIELVAEERRLSGAQGPGPGEAVMARLEALDAQLAARDAELEAATAHRVTGMLGLVEEDSALLEGHLSALAAVTTHAEEVVTEVVVHNYQLARQRLYDLVLRADLGHVEVGWARRQAHRQRLEALTRQRAREVDGLDAERRAILDEPLGLGSEGP